jgi:hypothetical protein
MERYHNDNDEKMRRLEFCLLCICFSTSFSQAGSLAVKHLGTKFDNMADDDPSDDVREVRTL